jgi:hypothetical protein
MRKIKVTMPEGSSVVDDLFQKPLYARRYWRTRNAVMNKGELYELSRKELEEKYYLDGLTFNLQQNILSSLPAVLLLTVLNFLRPIDSAKDNISDVVLIYNPISYPLNDYLLPFYIPFTLTIVALVAATVSIKTIPWISKNDTKNLSVNDRLNVTQEEIAKSSTWARKIKAFWYYDGTYGLWPQMLASVCVVVAQSRHVDLFSKYELLMVIVGIVSFCVTMWQLWITY